MSRAQVFDAVDKDGGGTLSVSEVRDLMHMLGLKVHRQPGPLLG